MPEIQRFCPHCNRPVEATDEYCPYCGKKLSDIDEKRMTGEPYTKKEKQTTFSVDSRSINDNSTLSFVLGIAAFFVPYIGLICAILAIVFGRKYRKENSYAKAGFILGIVACSLIAAYTVVTIALLMITIIGSFHAVEQMKSNNTNTDINFYLDNIKLFLSCIKK